MDAPGDPATAAGLTHIVIAAGLVVTCIAAMALAALAWWRARAQRVLIVVTVVLLLVMLVAGFAASQAATAGWPLLGLWQRFTIGAYLVWIAILAFELRRAPRRP